LSGRHEAPGNDGDGGKIRDEGPGLKSQSRKHETQKAGKKIFLAEAHI
jgi:hypothetical protein